jgi:hypothetical protein
LGLRLGRQRGRIRGDRGRVLQLPVQRPQIDLDHGGLLLFDQRLVQAGQAPVADTAVIDRHRDATWHWRRGGP